MTVRTLKRKQPTGMSDNTFQDLMVVFSSSDQFSFLLSASKAKERLPFVNLSASQASEVAAAAAAAAWLKGD